MKYHYNDNAKSICKAINYLYKVFQSLAYLFTSRSKRTNIKIQCCETPLPFKVLRLYVSPILALK